MMASNRSSSWRWRKATRLILLLTFLFALSLSPPPATESHLRAEPHGQPKAVQGRSGLHQGARSLGWEEWHPHSLFLSPLSTDPPPPLPGFPV